MGKCDDCGKNKSPLIQARHKYTKTKSYGKLSYNMVGWFCLDCLGLVN